jgi:hypothetical protein
MTRLFFVLVLCFLACNGPRPIDGAVLTEAEVREFISHYDKTWEKRDTAGMKMIMDEQYRYFSSTGSVTDRGSIISWFTPADKYRVDTAYRQEISIVIFHNTAIVSSRWKGNGVFGTEKFNDDQRCSLVIQKSGGTLRLIAEHCTQINATHG